MSSRRTAENANSRGRLASTRASSFNRVRGSRRLENIASVSRSSGLEKDGDALKDLRTQEEYRQFIQGKLDSFWARPAHSSDQQSQEIRENILILFRECTLHISAVELDFPGGKLREGIVASKRNDRFSVQVYETSLYLSTIFDNTRQLGSVLAYFIPNRPDTDPTEALSFHTQSANAVLVALVNQLVLGYPSQNACRRSVHAIPGNVLPRASRRWILDLLSSLWARNFSKFEKLTRQTTFIPLIESSSLTTGLGGMSISDSSAIIMPDHDLAEEALCHAIDALRLRVRNSAWKILCSSYRELACHSNSETRDWLVRSLVLAEDHSALEEWLEEKKKAGHVRPKEGVEGRWIVCKVSQ
ncbi:hypothetical protein D9757_003390 [Collybiopsis confluens]|uniref:Uncharacterized protein n=1 Tax=Collybiopsis confluens TaxID=2823264 RepID=A0A8H5MCU5_9AGAR|nr:hypothetical protein D9757_003390 [Collybiopsis confluens]